MAYTNPLISSTPSNLQVSLHPLVLLTISDHITRRSIRQFSNTTVGILLGQQKGREITVEHAFDCLVQGSNGSLKLDHDYLSNRLQQYREVHKDPALELVGWYTPTPPSGPTLALLPIHSQIANLNESALLLAFHASELTGQHASSAGPNPKLPLTVYETIQGVDNSAGEDENSKAAVMQIDGEEAFPYTFRSIAYSIETDETEMIAIDFIAKGAGNASVQGSGGSSLKQTPKSDHITAHGVLASQSNGDASSSEGPTTISGTSKSTQITDDSLLSPLEADQVASLGTRLNSVKMLQSRLQLLHHFLSSLTESYISNTELSETFLPETETSHVRSIAALLKQLSLLTPKAYPPTSTASTSTGDSPRTPNLTLHSSILAQRNDSSLLDLLSSLTTSIQSTSEVGRKHAAIESARQQAKSKKQSTAFGTLGNTMGGNGFGAYGSGNSLSGIPDEGYEGEGGSSWQ